MQMKSLRAIMAILVCTTLLYACSESVEDPAEPGSIRAQTEEIGHEAAQMIQEPMDRAQEMADQENERIRQLEERLNN